MKPGRTLLVVAAAVLSSLVLTLDPALGYDSKRIVYPIVEPKPNAGLDEIARRNEITGKPYDLLVRGEFVQSELVCYRDPSFGSEVWRITNDPADDTHHSTGRSMWNANATMLVFRSQRPGGQRMLMNADGTGLRTLRSDPAHLALSVLPAWDNHEAKLMYVCDREGVYRMDALTGKTSRILALYGNIYRSIWTPVARNDYMMVNSYDLDSGNLTNEIQVFRTDGSDRHVLVLRQGVHDCRLNVHPVTGEMTVGYGYGKTIAEGEYVGRTMSLDGKTEVSESRGQTAVEQGGHGCTSRDGKRSAYYMGKDGLVARNWDGSDRVVIADFPWTDGHSSWNNFDDDWCFFTPGPDRPSGIAGLVCRIKADGSGTIHRIASVYRVPYKDTYHVCPRGVASPDGTKVYFDSAVFGNLDCYIAVVKRPDPPRNVRGAKEGVLMWDPPELAREVVGYNVYVARASGGPYELLTREPVKGTMFDPPAPNGPFVVTSVDGSGLESIVPSREARVPDRPPARVTLEPEFGTVTLPMRIGRDAFGASGWFYVWALDEGKPATVEMDAQIDCPAKYVIWARTRVEPGPQGPEGAFDVSIDGKPAGTVKADSKSWEWAKCETPFDFLAGTHKVAVSTTGRFIALDKIILATDPAFIPKGDERFRTEAPKPPSQVSVEKVADGRFRLKWKPSPSPNLHHYNVYTANAADFAPAQANLVASPPAPDVEFLDWQASPGKPAFYKLTAVDRLGQESDPTAPAGQ